MKAGHIILWNEQVQAVQEIIDNLQSCDLITEGPVDEVKNEHGFSGSHTSATEGGSLNRTSTATGALKKFL